MNLSELPWELIDEILKRLDAISLAKSRQVCRSWRSLHSQPKYKLLWRRSCLRDIPGDVLIELTGSGYIDEKPGRISDSAENFQVKTVVLTGKRFTKSGLEAAILENGLP